MKKKIEILLTKIFGNKILFVVASPKTNYLKTVEIVYGSKGDRMEDAAMVQSNLRLYGVELRSIKRRRTKRIILAPGFHRLLK